MRRRFSKEEKRKIIIDYIKKNPYATHRDIRKETKLHPERVFNSLEKAFNEAKYKPPRNFRFKTKEERKRIIADYIRKNPGAGGQTIARDLKINVRSAFDSIEEAYSFSGVNYPRKIDLRESEQKKKEIIQVVKDNPLITFKEIVEKTKTKPYNFFKNMSEIYKKAGVYEIKRGQKWRMKKQNQVIDFVRNNPFATQREINKACKTHVQSLFDEGIFEAYKRAKIKFPFERLKTYGVGLEEIRKRAKSFEEEISIKLSGYGKVNKLVKTKRGVADIILERKGKKSIIEIKDYKLKEISISQINQLNRYLDDTDSVIGILICHKKPKKDKFLIGKNKIFVLEKENLDEIPEIIDREYR